jgi:hypothetical protein
MPAAPPPLAEGAIVAMKLAAAIAYHGAARRRGDEVSERVHAVLQGHAQAAMSNSCSIALRSLLRKRPRRLLLASIALVPDSQSLAW